MQPQPHISPATASAAISAALESQRVRKNRGSYNCGRCGQPKKGHVCLLTATPDVPTTPIATEPVSYISAAASSSRSTVLSLTTAPSSRQSFTHLRRALSFDDVDARNSLDESDLDAASPDLDLHLDTDIVQPGKFHAVALWEVLKRLPPSSLLMAARVCKRWRETSRKMWKAAEELRIRVPEKAQIGYIGSLLQKCPRLIRLSLKIER